MEQELQPTEDFGLGPDGEQITSETPEVQAELQKYPDLNLDAAIGNVITNKNKVISAVADSTMAEDLTNDNLDKLATEKENAIQTSQDLTPTSEISNTNIKINPTVQKINSEIERYNSTLESLKSTADDLNSQLIQSIQDTYEQRRKEMSQLNTNTLNGLTRLGVRSGRQRYASEIQTSILSAEERAGIERMSALDAEEKSLILQAETAANEADFARLNTSMSTLSGLRKEKNDLIQQQITNAFNQDAAMRADIKFVQEQEDREIENIMEGMAGMLTGDPEADAALIEKQANIFGIDPNRLSSAANEFTREQATFNLGLAKINLDLAQSIPEGETFTDPTTGIVIHGTAKEDNTMQVERIVGNTKQLVTFDMTDKANPIELSAINLGPVETTGGAGDDTEIKAFQSDAAELIGKIDGDEDMDWATAFDMLRTKYPQATNETINNALGGGIPYNPETGEFNTKEAFGRAKKK